MGDIADMMLDGTLCVGCGVLLDEAGAAAGYPKYCADCKPQESSGARTIKCHGVRCNRKFATEAARIQHERDKHGIILPS